MTSTTGTTAPTYRLSAGDTLVLRSDDAPWERVTFRKRDFADIAAATAAEVVAALGRLEGLTADDDGGLLVLASVDTGDASRVEVDTDASTAAAALGLLGGSASGPAAAQGSGLGPARLVGTTTAPFRIPAKARMTVRVDGRGRRVTLDAASGASAQHVVDALNTTLRRPIARATADDRVALVSPTLGVGSSLEVLGPDDDTAPDAAAVLGLTGDSALSEPYRSEPARLVCAPAPDATVVVNLTASPVEVHLPAGPVVLAARGRLLLPREVAAGPVLRRLAEQGSVRLERPRDPA